MGTLTGVMSFEFVPSHFGPIWAEAVATAVCTSGLAFVVRSVRREDQQLISDTLSLWTRGQQPKRRGRGTPVDGHDPAP